MEDTTDAVNSLESKHRKEKKELQAKIQSIKKTIKGDKTKKKELTIEIARMESDLEAKQKQELESVLPIELDDNKNDFERLSINETESKQKVSKAQKRRDKKLQQEKDRQIEIKLQEEENFFGPRNKETQAIIKLLKDKKLKLFSIPSDGDCLYNSILHQLLTTKEKTVSIDELRQSVADHIRSNKDEFLPFMTNPDTFEMLNELEFEQYCHNIMSTKTWGGQLELRALSNTLKCPIEVIQAEPPNCIVQGDDFNGPPLIITYHRHIYKLGEHYNSTEILIE